MATKDTLYVQAELDYGDEQKEVCWILKSIAKEGCRIKVGDKKSDMVIATVTKAYDDVALTIEQIGINRQYPLRDATDI